MGNSGSSQLSLACVGLSCKLEKGSPSSSTWGSAHTRTPLVSGVSYTSALTPTSGQVPLCSAHTLQLSVTALLDLE